MSLTLIFPDGDHAAPRDGTDIRETRPAHHTMLGPYCPCLPAASAVPEVDDHQSVGSSLIDRALPVGHGTTGTSEIRLPFSRGRSARHCAGGRSCRLAMTPPQ
jgi:hypothetical protein